MKSKYKFLCVILACVCALLTFPSCAGTNAEEPETDVKIRVCYINAYDVNDESLGSVTIRDNEAKDLYKYFKKSGYERLLGAVRDKKPYISAVFETVGEDGNVDGEIAFYVYSTDKVEHNNEIIGKLGGAYEKLVSHFEKHFNKVKPVSLCTARDFDINGKETDTYRLIGDDARELFYELDDGEYLEDEEIPSRGAYVRLTYSSSSEFDTETGFMNDFMVYDDDIVLRRNIFSEDKYVELGRLKGVYSKVKSAVDRQKEIGKAEKTAGFSFSQVMFRTDLGVEYEIDDFEEIKCLDIGILLKAEDCLWWHITIDSHTEAEMLAAEKYLKERADVTEVNLDYIVNLVD
ncbi:MAG: hypothetical protein J6S71_00840 [Clostridia bacterium]|nr:hypothetical protein [Clostridia bacterium]